MSGPWRSRLVPAVAVAVFAAVVGFGMPLVTGAGWDRIGERLDAVPRPGLIGLAALWLLGLWVYTFVLTASFPGLSHGRAFVVNTAGSAVSNVVPLGGLAGVGVTAVLARRWGLPATAVATSVLVTGIWNAVAGTALPAAGLTLLAIGDPDMRGPAQLLLVVALWAATAVLVGAARSERAGDRIVAAAGRLVRLLPRAHRPDPDDVRASLGRLRHAVRDVAGTRWAGLTVAMAGYVALQALLFACCLALAGASAGVAAALSAFLVGRALSLLVVTPGGSGLTETGAVAVLVAQHADPAASAAGVLLFSTFVFVLEIPLGALTWTVSSGREVLAARRARGRQRAT